jgi:hypothetical protein
VGKRGFSFFLFVASCLPNQFALSGKRYAVGTKPPARRTLRVSFQASILFGRAIADVAQQQRISDVDELSSRSTDSISRDTIPIEYPTAIAPPNPGWAASSKRLYPK